MATAIAAVKETSYIEMVRRHTADWQQRIDKELSALGITVIPSAANFYLLNFNQCSGKSAKQAADFLETEGIIPRTVDAGAGNDVLRITVGLDAENEAVIKALRKYMC